MDGAQLEIEEMRSRLSESLNSTKVSNTEVDQLRDDMNFYRQETVINQAKCTKMERKVDKMRAKRDKVKG